MTMTRTIGNSQVKLCLFWACEANVCPGHSGKSGWRSRLRPGTRNLAFAPLSGSPFQPARQLSKSWPWLKEADLTHKENTPQIDPETPKIIIFKFASSFWETCLGVDVNFPGYTGRGLSRRAHHAALASACASWNILQSVPPLLASFQGSSKYGSAPTQLGIDHLNPQ